jgi:hypothetical protein
MTPEERFDASIKLAEFSAGRWDARRSYEWKLSLGLWALLAAAIHSFRVDHIPAWLPLASIGLYVFWMNNIWWSNYLDRMMMRAYREHCTDLLNQAGPVYLQLYKPKLARWLAEHPRTNRFLGVFADWSSLFQIVVTSVLIFLAYRYCYKQPELIL